MQASELPGFSPDEAKNLTQSFTDVTSDLRKTLKAPPKKEEAIKLLEGAIENVNNFGASPEELINFYQDVSEAVDWKAIKGGKKHLQRIKKSILEALHEADPEIAKKFESTNELWDKLKYFRENVGKGDLEEWNALGEGAAFLGNLATRNIEGLVEITGIVLGREIVTKLLTDPKWQGIHRNIMHSIKRNDTKAGAATLSQLKRRVKQEFPEEYEEIEWPVFA